MNSKSLLWFAGVLIAVWIAARVIGVLAGALLHLLWIGAIILGVFWLIGKVTGKGRTRV